jgi:hypothetical protein
MLSASSLRNVEEHSHRSAAGNAIESSHSRPATGRNEISDILCDREYPGPNPSLPFRDGPPPLVEAPSRKRTMKITYLLAALLLVSSFATQATAHMRISKSSHRAHVRTYSLHRGIPLARSGFFNSYDSSPNGPTSVSSGGVMWNGRSASEFGG